MYTLDPQAAKKADTIGAYLSETGKYAGAFIRAEKLVSQRGTHGIGFIFKADDGRETRFDVYTQKPDGTALPGMNQVNAMMACLKLRTLTEATRKVKKWDNGSEQVMDAPCFVELMGPRIGLLLRSEEYEKMSNGQPTGETGWRMGLFACFQADTELTASEILDRKTTPEQLPKMLAMLSDKPLKSRKPNGTAPAAASGAGFDDPDIPF